VRWSGAVQPPHPEVPAIPFFTYGQKLGSLQNGNAMNITHGPANQRTRRRLHELAIGYNLPPEKPRHSEGKWWERLGTGQYIRNNEPRGNRRLYQAFGHGITRLRRVWLEKLYHIGPIVLTALTNFRRAGPRARPPM
jgi:hypothetical protein